MGIVSRSRWSVFAFAIVLCGCAAHSRSCLFWHVDTRPLSISSWNPPKPSMISCPWKHHETVIRGHKVEGKACDWNKIRCSIAYESCVQTSIKITKDLEVLVACLPHEKKSMRAQLTQPTTVVRRRRSVRRGCRKQRRKLCPQHPAPGSVPGTDPVAVHTWSTYDQVEAISP